MKYKTPIEKEVFEIRWREEWNKPPLRDLKVMLIMLAAIGLTGIIGFGLCYLVTNSGK